MKLKPMNAVNFIFFLPLFFTVTIITPPQFITSVKENSPNEETIDNSGNGTGDIPPQEYFQVTLPLPTDDITPSCSVGVLNHTVTDTVTVDYTPPPATCQWSVAVLDFRAECKGSEEVHGVAGVWIAGVELLRTSTAPPSENGMFWNVRKDVTKYSSVLAQKDLTVTVAFENLMLKNFSTAYSVNVSLLFYPDPSRFEANPLSRKIISVNRYEIGDNLSPNRVMKPSYPYDTPADLIIPVSGAVAEGFWFKIHNESDVKMKNFQIPDKTYKAVLELYVSFHGDDEFWYMNPPDSYATANNLPVTKTKGAYREVLVTIDGKLVGTAIPFPVLFPDEINPLFWKPVMSIGAFDLPSYDIDLTSYLGFVRDNKKHSIGFQVADGLPFWLVDANLHVWMDDRNVHAIVEYKPPSVEFEQENEFEGLNGEFETEVKRITSTIRWIHSSKGVMETKVTEEIRFKNRLKLKHFGPSASRKELEQTIRRKTKIKVMNRGYTVGETVIEKRYPLKITVESGGSRVNAIVEYKPPSVEFEQENEFEGLNGEFETEVKRITSTIRWIHSSKGVMETKVTEEIRFKNRLKLKHFGPSASRKELEQTIRRKTKIKVMNRGYTVGETVIEKRYPLKITVESGGSRVNTTVVQGRRERFMDEIGSISRDVRHEMNCSGWMVVKGNYGVVSGYTENHQTYSYKDRESGCFSRNVDAVGGHVVVDETTSSCVD